MTKLTSLLLIMMVFTSSSRADIDIPIIGKVITLYCSCDSAYNKSRNRRGNCPTQNKIWVLSTIHKAFYENSLTGRKYDGKFTITDSSYKLVVPGIKTEFLETYEKTITLNRFTLALITENDAYRDNYSCVLEPKI